MAGQLDEITNGIQRSSRPANLFVHAVVSFQLAAELRGETTHFSCGVALFQNGAGDLAFQGRLFQI